MLWKLSQPTHVTSFVVHLMYLYNHLESKYKCSTAYTEHREMSSEKLQPNSHAPKLYL